MFLEETLEGVRKICTTTVHPTETIGLIHEAIPLLSMYGVKKRAVFNRMKTLPKLSMANRSFMGN